MPSLRRLLLSRAWLFAVAFGCFAYSFHKIGARLGYYPRFFWFQMAAHFFSASAMALLLARAGLDMGLRRRPLVGFVIAFSLVGAVGWEYLEYIKFFKALHWWGIEDSLLDLGMDALGVGTILALLGTRIRPVIDPTVETPGPSDALRRESRERSD